MECLLPYLCIVGHLYSGHLGSVFSCPDCRGVRISGVMYLGLKLMDIINYRCRDIIRWPYWVANEIYLVVNVRAFIVELNSNFLET